MKVRLVKLALAGLLVAVLALAQAGTAAAEAVETHYLSSTFGDGELSLEERSGVVYDKETEEVYVADTGHGRIARFGAEGEPLGVLATLTEPTYLAIDHSTGDVYVGEGKEGIVKLDPSGTPIAAWGTGGHMGGFGEIVGIAVDPTGNLFVIGADFTMHELSAGGSQGNECGLPYLTGELPLSPRGIAADGEGALYFSYIGQRIGHPLPQIVKMTSACEGVDRDFNSGDSWNTVTVDESDNSLYLADNSFNPELERSVEHVTSEGEGIPSNSLNPDFGNHEGLFAPGQLTVNSEDETVYVESLANDDIVVFLAATIQPPELELLPPTEVTGTSAHLQARVNPGAPEDGLRAWEVRAWFGCVNLTTEKGGPCNEVRVPSSSEPVVEFRVPAGSEPVVIEGTVEGLEPASEYALSVHGVNWAEAEAQSPDLYFQTAAIAPGIYEDFVTEASESGATLSALINPHGAETGYRVEYVTKAQFEASGFAEAARTPEQQIPAGVKAVPVSEALSGLVSSTPYMVRVFATNTIEGSVEEVFSEPVAFTTREPTPALISGCANEAFRSGFGALLPDCRAYEQSTPIDKNGQGPESVPGVLQATEEPAGITFFAQGGIPGGVGGQDYPSFLSTRGEGSWSTQGLLPPAALGRRGGYLGLTPGGHYAITEARRYDPASGKDGTGLFERDLQSGQMTTIVPYDSECSKALCFNLAGASADGSRVLIESSAPLTKGQAGEETPAGQHHVFFWERGTGQISLVDVREDGVPLPEGGFAGPLGGAFGKTHVGGTVGEFYVQALNAVSRDGNTVVYSEAGPSEEEREEGEEGDGHLQLYVRTGLGSGSPRTIKVSAYQEGLTGPEYPAEFLEATPDGRYVFFMSKAELTSDAYSGEGTASLYRYDVAAEELIDVTSEKKQKFQAGPGIVGMIGAGESGEKAYLVSTTVLTTEPGPGGAVAEAKKPNLYLWQEGAKKPYSFIATLRGRSEQSSDARDWSQLIEGGIVVGAPSYKSARVSADGSAVVFSSHRALTGKENRSRSCGFNGGFGPCAEFFRYSAATGSLDCVSCNPTGVQPLGSASIGTPFIEALDLPLIYGAPFLPKNLSADGSRFFFQTPNPLVGADVNGGSGCRMQEREATASCMDVYEWEAPGAGSCPQASAASADGGCVYLLSSGQSDQGSYFADADREGRNAYFVTYSQLAPADRDHISDIYDAAEGGGLASQNTTPALPCGSRQACQGAQSSPQAVITPATSSFAGPGNPRASATCGKGHTRRHGRCVKKTRHHKKRHSRHQRKGKAHKGGRR